MKKSARISIIAKIEEAKEREEARKLAEYQRAVLDKKTKLQELQGFLNEYKERFMKLTRFGASADKIRSSHAFISQLNKAISQQHNAVADAERAADEYREQWLRAKRRMEILQKAVNNLRRQERQHEDRKEQLTIDELARRKRQAY